MSTNLDNLTLGELRQINGLFGGQSTNAESAPFIIGKGYLVRTVTHITVGRVKSVGTQEIVLEDASWVADTGRFADALKNGIETLSNSEIEPFVHDVIIGRGAIVDATLYTHALPRDQK